MRPPLNIPGSRLATPFAYTVITVCRAIDGFDKAASNRGRLRVEAGNSGQKSVASITQLSPALGIPGDPTIRRAPETIELAQLIVKFRE